MAIVTFRHIFAAALLLSPVVLHAQALSCAIPAQIERPRPDTPDARDPRRVMPTASYTLALSWGPQFCRERGDAVSFQCGSGNRFGFVLHGLWPDGAGKDWPQFCRSVDLLPESTIRANLCATPSAQLLQHEWAKHGSCTGLSADAYFAQATGLFRALRFPDMNALSRRRPLTAGMVAAAIARANPGMTPDMLRVTVTRRRWLDEVWLCRDLQLRPARCPATKGGVAPSTPVAIWRGE